MEEKLLEEIKSKLINILPKESEIDAGFNGIKFYRRNDTKKTHICIQCPCIIFVVNGEKHTHISSENFIFKKGIIILHTLIILFLLIFIIFQKITHIFLYIFL